MRTLLKRYLAPVVVTLIIVAVYHSVDIKLFRLDLNKRLRQSLFQVFTKPRLDESIVLLNIGKLDINELEKKVDSLLKCYPRKIGINLCHYRSDSKNFNEHFKEKRSVVIANCFDGEPLSQSRIINGDNSVTHFRSDRKNYFEFKIDLFKSRGNDTERIYFTDSRKTFHHWELSNIAFLPEYFQGKTVLIGYMGDYLTDSIYYYSSSRITPMNQYLEDGLPDMYDTEISAHIIRTFSNNNFINEIEQLPRIAIILFASILNVLLLTLFKTRWPIVNLLVAALLFLIFTTIFSFLIAYLFVEGYYLSLDELPLILLVTTIFTVGLNILESRKLHSVQNQKN